MAKRIVCIDTELSCWDDPAFQKSQTLEIFQFGLALINADTLEIEKTGSYYVSNTRHEVSKFCYQLTGISQSTLDKRGMPLDHVTHLLKERWGVAQRWNALVTWGDERRWMEPDFVAKGVEYPFHNGLLNLADYYRFCHCQSKRDRASQKAAAERYGVTLAQPQHNAEADATTLARIVIAMIKAGELWAPLNASGAADV
ncbi:3'-5' exonuclease [Ferrimonas marina]|uniref:Inhibitor of the KinA pathway to sporulation, predicted exonuclease n=1 Tax=Ferrimonas marina TaxID=299255 RepID=A0A1M5ZF71_9GAMM|nr:3'-5' exonuclease [Ferrimonas marina]SHI22812.1 Inhibitor of the KinA pathway to sporulation, predicted exonuclease [Ferrimonas marina]